MLNDSIKQTILKAAIFAPSADNSQPVQFSWFDENSLDVWIDESRSGKSSDNRFVLSDIAIGAVIENITIKASSLSLTSNIQFFPESESSPYFIARIVFIEQHAPADEELSLAIPDRCTDRRFPFKGPIEKETLDKLTEAGETYNCGVNWFTNKASIKRALPVIQKAESIRFKSQKLHEELFSTVKFGEPDADEGMPIEVLAIEKPAQPFFKMMKKWSFMRYFNMIGAYAMLGLRSVRIPILFSPALVLITIKKNDRLSVINGGRALQRLWLQATVEGVAIQPYAAPGIFSLGFVDHESKFDNDFQEVTTEMGKLVSNNYGLVFLRLGMSSKVEHRTNRRDSATFIRTT